MVTALPQELQKNVLGFLDADSVKALHSVSKDMSVLTTGTMKSCEYGKQLAATNRREFHNWMGGRLWKLYKEQESLHEAYRKFKCRGNNEYQITRANHHSDFEVYDKCIRILNKWWCGHIFTVLRCAMDCVADVDKIPLHVEGYADSDCYYRREGITAVAPLPISEGPTFTRGDLVVVLGWLRRLHAISLEVEGWARTISKRHDFYSRNPGDVKRVRSVLEKRIRWLEAKL